MTEKAKRILAAIVATAALAAGMTASVSTAANAGPPDAGAEPDLRTCGGQPFSLDVFQAPAGFQRDPGGLAKALRYEISIDRTMPKRGWRVIASGEGWAELIAGKPKREGNVWLLFRKSREGRWGVDQGWFGCWFEPVRDGASAGEWSLADGQKLKPRTKSLKVEVFEMSCNSGRPARNRVLAPSIEYRPNSVVVTYFVRWNRGPQTCPSNPPTRKTLRLAEPLGDRALLDGGRYPAPIRARSS